jgi:hypothetical protein
VGGRRGRACGAAQATVRPTDDCARRKANSQHSQRSRPYPARCDGCPQLYRPVPALGTRHISLSAAPNFSRQRNTKTPRSSRSERPSPTSGVGTTVVDLVPEHWGWVSRTPGPQPPPQGAAKVVIYEVGMHYPHCLVMDHLWGVPELKEAATGHGGTV